MNIEQATEWASQRTVGVLITLRRDGRPQSSDIAYVIVDGKIVISLTESRAKTRNIRADNRVVVHVTDPASWSYVSFDGVAELSPTATALDDSSNDALVEYYEAVTGGPHPDWAEYRQAMIDEGRLLATVTIGSAVGQIN